MDHVSMLVNVALMGVLIISCVIELKTSLIPNSLCYSSAILFLTVNMVFQEEERWLYPLAMLLPCVILSFVFGYSGGAAKLASVIGAAVGLQLTVVMTISCLIINYLVGWIALKRFGKDEIPSTPTFIVVTIGVLASKYMMV